MESGKFYVGIDPGKQGGVGVINAEGSLINAFRMPGTEAGVIGLLDQVIIERQGRVIFILEKSQAMPKQGVSSTFNYGMGYGILKGAIRMSRNPLHEVRPADWKKEILAGFGDKKSKKTAIIACENVFPNADLMPGQCKKPQDGMAEALLIAEFGRRKNF